VRSTVYLYWDSARNLKVSLRGRFVAEPDKHTKTGGPGGGGTPWAGQDPKEVLTMERLLLTGGAQARLESAHAELTFRRTAILRPMIAAFLESPASSTPTRRRIRMWLFQQP